MSDTAKEKNKEIGIPVKIAFGIGTDIGLIAAVIYAGYKIDRRYHNEIHAALVAKGAR